MSKVPAAEQLVALAKEYDHVIIDLGAGIEQHVQVMSALASKVVVVLTDEPTSLTDAYAFIKLCVTRENPPAIHVVVNQAAGYGLGDNYDGVHPAPSGEAKLGNRWADAILALRTN